MDESRSLPGSTPQPPPLPPGQIQFDKVEYADQSVSANCVACGQPITDCYYEANGKIVCPRCKEQLRGSIGSGSQMARLIKAIAYGIGAATLSALAYHLIRRFAGDFAITTIAMGWFIGKAVHTATDNRGGAFYIILAVAFTYLSIAVSLMAWELSGHDLSTIEIGQWIYIFGVTFAIPVIYAVNGPLLFLIYGFGLWQAGRMNVRSHIAVTGPYYTRGGTAAGPAGGYIADDTII